MRSKWWWGCLVVSVAVMPAGADAGPAAGAHLIAADTSFFCTRDAREPNGAAGGMVCEMLRDMAGRTGYGRPIEVYPLQRALRMAAAGPSVLLAPVARTAAREAYYQWLAKLVEDDLVVVALRGSPVDISSLDKIRDLNVGVVRDGVAAQMAALQGWRGVQPATRDVTNALKLDRGRLDAWLGPWNAILTSQRAAGLPVDGLRRGVVVHRVRAYLVGSPDLAPAVGAVWKKAFDDMVRDGTYARLLRKHDFVAPPPVP